MRVLVTGSRNWSDRLAVYRILNHVCEEFGLNYPPDEYGNTMPDRSKITVVTGACPKGADHWAEEWCVGNDFLPETHPADWSRGLGSGLARNRHMVELGADLCVAFIAECIKPSCLRRGAHGSHGSVDCSRRAEAKNIRTLIYTEGWTP